MPADDATGPTGRAASIGFYANADDSLRVVSDTTRPTQDRPADRPAAATAPRGSGLIVALATVLLAGTAVGFAWTLTPAGRQTPESGPSTAPAQLPPQSGPTAAPAQLPPQPPPAAELQPPAPAPAIEAPPPARAAHVARHHRAPSAQPLQAAANHPVRHPAARRRHPATADLAEVYARAIDDLDRRRAQAAGGDPPF